MLLNMSRASYQLCMVGPENPQDRILNFHFSFHLLKQCYQKFYQSISISEMKRVYHY